MPVLVGFEKRNEKEQEHQFCNQERNTLHIPDCLLACYPFNGDANDASGNKHHGVVYGATLTKDRFGNPNSAYYFDGDEDKIEVAGHPDLRLNNTDFTISIWMKEDAYNPDNSGTLVNKRGIGRKNGWFLSSLGLDDNYQGNVLYNVSGGGDPFVMTWSGEITLKEWHHIMAVYTLEQQELSIYIDGKLIKSQKGIPSPNLSTTAQMVFGYDHSTGVYDFKGTIDDIAIYNCAFSPQQVESLAVCGSNTSQHIKTNELFVLDNIHFESSKYDLKPASYPELDRLTLYLLENEKLKLFIYGHTDNLGDANANQRLSEDRASEVARYLIQKGITQNRIWTKGFGSTQPIADNSTEAGRQKNRRVAFLLKEVSMP